MVVNPRGPPTWGSHYQCAQLTVAIVTSCLMLDGCYETPRGGGE